MSNELLRHTLESASRLLMYQGKLGQFDSENISSLPFTTRVDLAAAFAGQKDGGFDTARAALVHLTPAPGGWMPEFLSTGDLETQAEATAELFRRIGVGPGSRVIVAFGYHVFAGGWLFHDALVRAGATVLPHGPGEAERLASIAREHQFDVLVANPTFALRLAELGARFKLLIAAGEPFSSVPGFRERVEAAIEGSAIDCFGMSETGIVAAETLSRDGLEPLPGMAMLEVIDPQTLVPTPDGEKGELVVTTLARELMPLIRFRTGDLTVVQRLPDGSIRLPRGVIGRVDEMLKVKGVKLYPKELGPILASIPGLDAKQYQLIVSRITSGTDSLELRVVVDSNADLSPLEARFRAALGINMNAVQIVDSLEGPMVTDSR